MDFDFSALEQDLPGVFVIDAGEDFHQRGFARAVFADQRVDFARVSSNRQWTSAWTPGKVFSIPSIDTKTSLM